MPRFMIDPGERSTWYCTLLVSGEIIFFAGFHAYSRVTIVWRGRDSIVLLMINYLDVGKNK